VKGLVEKIGTGTGSSTCILVFPCQYRSITAHLNTFIIGRTSGRSLETFNQKIALKHFGELEEH
jgi:hypothetical protein